MSTLELENIKHPDNSGNNIELAADGSVGNLNLSGNMGIGTNSPLSSPAGAFSWANPIATIEGSRPTLYLNGSGSLATIRMWPSGTDGSSTTLDDFHINAIATSGSTPGSLTFAAQGGAIGAGLSINSNNIVTTPDQPVVFVSRTSTQAVTTDANSGTILDFTSTQYNIGGHFNISNNKFTAPITGRYEISWSYGTNVDGASVYRTYIWKNNNKLSYTQLRVDSNGHTGYVFGSRTAILELSANDYIDLRASCDGGTNFYADNELRIVMTIRLIG